jgi:UDP-N-acetylglucosamine:LPS N-acetylglucosamine transferase
VQNIWGLGETKEYKQRFQWYEKNPAKKGSRLSAIHYKLNNYTVEILLKPLNGITTKNLIKHIAMSSFFKRKSTRYAIPFLVLVLGGSFGLKEFAQLR